jgi:hypothetical protein
VGDGCLDHNKWETHFASLIGASFFGLFKCNFVKCIFKNKVLFSPKEKAVLFSPKEKAFYPKEKGVLEI